MTAEAVRLLGGGLSSFRRFAGGGLGSVVASFGISFRIVSGLKGLENMICQADWPPRIG